MAGSVFCFRVVYKVERRTCNPLPQMRRVLSGEFRDFEKKSAKNTEIVYTYFVCIAYIRMSEKAESNLWVKYRKALK